MRTIGIIPARYASTRLPAKALAMIAGKPMVQHVYERASHAVSLDEVVVATDDERIMQAVREFGGHAEMTSPNHKSGSDRVAELAIRMDADVIVNIQGDEVMIDPEAIDAAVGPFHESTPPRISTLATPIRELSEHLDHATVKVVCDRDGWALYFSRAPIPFFRIDGQGEPSDDAPRKHPASGLWPLKHIGLYVYALEDLLWFTGLPQSPLELTEGLEQLRALENGCRIRVVLTEYSSTGVDTAEDLEKARRMLEGVD